MISPQTPLPPSFPYHSTVFEARGSLSFSLLSGLKTKKGGSMFLKYDPQMREGPQRAKKSFSISYIGIASHMNCRLNHSLP